jgi:hypothetical protein
MCSRMCSLSHYICMNVLCHALHTIRFASCSTQSEGKFVSLLIEPPGKSGSQLLKHISDLKSHFVCSHYRERSHDRDVISDKTRHTLVSTRIFPLQLSRVVDRNELKATAQRHVKLHVPLILAVFCWPWNMPTAGEVSSD